MTTGRKSLVGFTVVKLAVSGVPFFLMRINPKWKDINFIGGHVKERDAGSFERAARRELWEEVPPIRQYGALHLEPLTPTIHYGPIRSVSQGGEVEYEIQFFLLRMDRSPEAMLELLGSRTKNVLISQHDLLYRDRYRVSGLVGLLDKTYPGGLENIPFSSPIDLGAMREWANHLNSKQLEFALK